MPLIVEDGTGLATAESYASVAEADTRLANYGFSAWASLATAAKETALRLATDFMVNSYRTRWKGYRVNSVQALDWPRYEVEVVDALASGYGGASYYASNTVPVEIKQACIDLAYKTTQGVELSPDVDQAQKRVKVGPIEVEYDTTGNQATIFRAAESKLRPFLNGGGAMARLVRT
jgi:hypothetical protein